MSETLYSRGKLPDGEYDTFRKVRPTAAVRMRGRFECLTSEGNVAACDDGWLAVDSEGHPYPVNAHEFEATYVALADEEEKCT